MSLSVARAWSYALLMQRASRILCGFVPLCFGLLCLILIRAGFAPLVEPPPSYFGMAAFTAACFVILGLGFLAGNRRIAIGLCALAALLGGFRLLLYATALDHNSKAVCATLGICRMAPLAGMGFLAAGAAMILLRLSPSRTKRIAIDISGSVVLAVGTGPVIGYLAHVTSRLKPWFFTHPSVQVTIVFILLGLGIILLDWKESIHEPFPRWLPACCGIVAAAVAVYLWQALISEMAALIRPRPISPNDLALPRLFLWLGLLTSMLLAWVVALVRTARVRERHLRNTNDELQAEIARRSEMEAALRRSESRHRENEASFRLLFRNNPQPMWVLDYETLEFLEVNEAARSHYGYTPEQFRAMHLGDLLDESAPDAKPVPDPSQGSVYQLRLASGTLIEAEVEWYRLIFQGRDATLWVVTDVTERARVEEKVRQTQKLEGIGRLAGGISHDFNNLLTIISGYSHLLVGALANKPDLQDQAREVVNAADRAAALVTQLLAFSRRQLIEPQLLDPNSLVGNVDRLLRRLIGEEIDLRTVLEHDVWLIRADPNQIEQVLMNLALNARDAMPAGGLLEISTSNRTLAAEDIGKELDCPPGDYVRMAVQDTGEGMSPDVITRIFEPFFTTKERGKGTGLGLAIVYGIVKQSGGDIAVTSVPGEGTCFEVLLPRAAGEDPQPAAPAPDHILHGSETVLLAEDEASVRAITRDMLASRGYRVLEAGSAPEALRMGEKYDGQIDLLITDVVMPGGSGRDLATALLRMRPELKVLFISGHMEDAVLRHGVQSGSFSFLSKPFTPEGLNAKVREILTESAQPG